VQALSGKGKRSRVGNERAPAGRTASREPRRGRGNHVDARCAERTGGALQFFGDPVKIFAVIWEWFSGGAVYEHLWVTLQETALAFVIGSVLGLAFGLWLGLAPTASALLDPYITAMNAMPRVVLAPILMVSFGLGI
jgi:ABC-type nitrate/sulfonate/bicarbonate transport system permease component